MQDQPLGGTFSSICHKSMERTARAQNLPALDPVAGENIMQGSHKLISDNKNHLDVFQTLSHHAFQNLNNGALGWGMIASGNGGMIGQSMSLNIA
jgi:hypothetical protein